MRALALALAVAASAGDPASAGEIAAPEADVGSLLLADAMKAADKRQWDDAAALARRSPDPLARTIVDWRRMVVLGGSWDDLTAFLSARPGWPLTTRIRAKAEAAMPLTLSSREVLAFFEDRAPISGGGALRLAEALKAAGRDSDAREVIRSAWTRTPMGEDERAAFLARHGALIRDLHAQRADEMAWTGRESDARALKPYLDAGESRLIEARTALSARERGVDGKVKAVPAKLRSDPGLAWARFDWRLSRGLSDGATELLTAHSVSAAMLGRPDAWANGRARLARAAYRDGRFRDAYRFSAQHHLTQGADFADLEWFAGWVALNKLGDARAAARHFETLYNNVSSPISLSRGAYWAARAQEKAGNRTAAAEWRRRAAAHDETFYGQLAAMDAGAGDAGPTNGSGPRQPSQATRENELLRAALALASAGRLDLGRYFIQVLATTLPGAELSAVALRMLDIGQPHYALRLAKAARRDGHALDEALFPVIDLPNLPGAVDTALALAIMRQESEFNPQAISRAGARGLMQLMPATAERTAPVAGLRYDGDRLLSDWRYNAALGRTYLAEMLAEFGGSIPLAVAAYNAGPHRVTEWISRFGDPRSNQIGVIDWVETIPFAETRNYVQRVLEARAVYQHRLTGAPVEQSLAHDLFGGRG